MATTVLIHVGRLTFTNLVWLHIWNHWSSSRVCLPMVRYFFSSSIYVRFKFYFRCYHFLFLCALTFFVDEREPLPSFNYSFLSNVTWVFHEETVQLCDLCVWTSRCTGTSHPQTVKDAMRLATEHNVHLLSGNDLWTEELAENLYFL